MRRLVAILLALVLALPHVPYGWGHALTDACTWRARGSLGFLIGSQGAGADKLQAACWTRRGLASPSPFVRTVLKHWPSEAELTAWRTAP